jgi:tetratricopeptide (TPR) repeat protein
MSRATIITLLTVAVAGAAAIAIWKPWNNRKNQDVSGFSGEISGGVIGGASGGVPMLSQSQIDAGEIDPQVVELIQRTIAEVERSPGDASARAKLGAVYHANGLLGLARVAYEQSIELQDDQPRVWHHLALLHAANSDFDSAIESMTRAIELDPGNATLRWRRGFWQLDQGLFDDALSSFNEAVRLNRNEIAGHVGLARVNLLKHEYAEAAAILQTIVERATVNTPNVSYVRQLLGAAERGLGKSNAAHGNLTLGRSGVEVDWPDQWQDEINTYRTGYHPTLKRIEGELAAGNIDSAIMQIDEVLRSRPNDLGVLNYLAGAQFMKGQWREGIRTLETALAIDPNHYASHLNMTVGLLGIGDVERALTHAQAAVKANPTYGDAHLRLGRVLIRLNRVQDAVEPLTKAVQLGSNDAETRTLLGQTLLNVRQWKEAVRVFAQAIQSDPEHAPALVGLALAKAELGAIAEAKDLLSQARRLDPKVKNLDKIAARVGELEQNAAIGPRLPN